MADARYLIVLDLNGTLLHTSKHALPDTCGRLMPPFARTSTKVVYLRPGACEFLRWLSARFDVGIWTSCIKKNAEDIVEKVVPHDVRSKLKFVLSRDHCEKIPGAGFKTIKDLNVVWGMGFGTPTTTIAVDDTETKFSRQPEMLLPIKQYIANAPFASSDRELEVLKQTILLRTGVQ